MELLTLMMVIITVFPNALMKNLSFIEYLPFILVNVKKNVNQAIFIMIKKNVVLNVEKIIYLLLIIQKIFIAFQNQKDVLEITTLDMKMHVLKNYEKTKDLEILNKKITFESDNNICVDDCYLSNNNKKISDFDNYKCIQNCDNYIYNNLCTNNCNNFNLNNYIIKSNDGDKKVCFEKCRNNCHIQGTNFCVKTCNGEKPYLNLRDNKCVEDCNSI